MYVFGLTEAAICFASILFIFTIENVLSSPKPPVFNIYQRQNKCFLLKLVLIYVFFTLKKINKLRSKRKLKCKKLDETILMNNSKGVHTIYFNGSNNQGNFFILGLKRTPDEIKISSFILRLYSTNMGLLEAPKTKVDYGSGDFIVNGLKVLYVKETETWRITYEGKMKPIEEGSSEVDAKIDIVLTFSSPCFNFDANFDTLSLAKSLAKETWNFEYFKTLRSLHQSCYEQFGNFRGNIIINGSPYEINVDGRGFHSFSKTKSWKNLHRYVLNCIVMENGDCITIGIISMPITISNMLYGFVHVKTDDKIYPIQKCNMLLYQHGENGSPPKNYTFSFTANKKLYMAQVCTVSEHKFVCSKNTLSRMIHCFCKYEINEQIGWGTAEWMYRN